MKLFEARKRLFPQKAKGRFRKIKSILNVVFLVIYLLVPFLRFDRGVGAPDQAILIDFARSKFYFFFIEIWPQETYYFAGILIIAAIALFFVTSLFGRVWCGYACLQTVWTDIFIAIERFFQGDRNARIILDRKNSFAKFYKKSLTHLCWVLAGLITGFGFVAYYTDAIVLLQNIIDLNFSPVSTGWILGIALATYIMAGFAREQVCTFMCPYSRFQSAMFDDDTLIISYDEKRGEPRGKQKKANLAEEKLGDCIDCKQCVVVCPTGIDIRNGLQMECIACGLCIDACDDIMDKIGKPKGLIRYDTQKNLLNPSKENQFKILKPRTFFYSSVLLIVCGIMLFNLAYKPNVEANILQNRNPLFVKMRNGDVQNSYRLRIENKTHQKKVFALKIIEPKEAKYRVGSYGKNTIDNLPVLPDSIGQFKLFITLTDEMIEQSQDGRRFVNFVVVDKESEEETQLQTIFIGR